jgi:hypothetical protein
MLLKLAVAASRRGWTRISSTLLELDLALSGLSGASRRIRKEAKARRSRPHTRIELSMGEGR